MPKYVTIDKRLFEERKKDLKEQGPIAYAKRTFRTPCPTCEYDPVNKESMNPRCPTCHGSGFELETKFVELPAVVNLAIYTDDMMKAGVYSTDKCRILMDKRAWLDHGKYMPVKTRLYIDKTNIYEIESINFYGPGRDTAVAINCVKVTKPVEGVE
jgi:hypothetical protein